MYIIIIYHVTHMSYYKFERQNRIKNNIACSNIIIIFSIFITDVKCHPIIFIKKKKKKKGNL